jgi:hypothetical protein
MASHIDVHLGDYNAAVLANKAGVQADVRYSELRGVVNYYFTYRLHTYNQLIWSSNFDGQFGTAFAAAEAIIAEAPPELLARWPDWIEPLFSNVWYVLVRFGRWQEILERAVPAAIDHCVSRATGWWAKAIALGALGRMPEAAAAQVRRTNLVRRLAQKLGHLQPFIDAFPQGCTGQPVHFGPT